MTQIQLTNKIKALPPNLKNEVYDFIEFLLSKTKQNKNKIIPKFGSAKGKIIMRKDFDEPLDDFKEYM
jgi:hypothetical protein